MSAEVSVYTESNCRFAYQLRWGLTLFWRQSVPQQYWLEQLHVSLATDQLKILTWRWLNDDAIQFAVSARPAHTPWFIVQRVKGRLQHALRSVTPQALRPRYVIRSYGTQDRRVVEAYVSKQTRKHPMATPRTQRIFEDLVLEDPTVDLSVAQKTTHGDYWYNLHVVLVHEDRWCDVNPIRLRGTQQAVTLESQRRGWRLSRCAILADHLHLAVGCTFQDSPQHVILSWMNRIAEVYDGMRILRHSGFIGTFGEYDQRAIQGVRPNGSF